jgi:predicted nuclease with TOPRIM domain
MKHYKRMSADDYYEIKNVPLNTTKSIARVAKVYGRSYGTVKNVKKSISYEDYKRIVTEFNDKYHGKTNHQELPKAETKDNSSELALEALDNQFNKLKDAITTAILHISADEIEKDMNDRSKRIAELEKKISDLEKVIDLAKPVNVSDAVKSKLQGLWR